MAIDRLNNRKILFDKIKSSFVDKKGNILYFNQWEDLFFKSEGTCISDKPSAPDSNGYVKQNNLYDILTNVNKKGIILRDEYLMPKDSTLYISLRDKETFVRAYACNDFNWTNGHKFCVNSQDSRSITNLDKDTLDSLVGVYESNNKDDGKFEIFLKKDYSNVNDVPKLGIMSYYFSHLKGILENPTKKDNNLILDLSLDTSSSSSLDTLSSLLPKVDLSKFKSKITFSEDGKSFTYDLLGHKGTATKIEKKEVKKTDDKKDVEKKVDTEKPYKPHQTTLYSDEIDYDIINEPNLDIKNCNDFPFGLGCTNNIIGDINEKVFGKRRKNVYTKLLQNHLDNMGYFSIDNEENLITKEISDKILKPLDKSKIIKESVKKVLKEYINKKQ